MFLKRIFCVVVLLAMFCASGCSFKPKITDSYKEEIIVSEISPVEDFDYIDFFDFAIEVSKDYSFPPPIKYDKIKGLLVFGSEDFINLPGHKMAVYMWVDNPSVGSTEKVYINYEILDFDGSCLTETNADHVVGNFKNDLEQRYAEKVEVTNSIMEKYQVN